MSALVGEWSLESSENFENYMKHLGIIIVYGIIKYSTKKLKIF